MKDFLEKNSTVRLTNVLSNKPIIINNLRIAKRLSQILTCASQSLFNIN